MVRASGAASGRPKVKQKLGTEVKTMGHGRHGGHADAKCSRWLTFLRFYLAQMMKLSRVNPADERRGFGPSTRRGQLPIWSHAVLIFYTYFTLKLLLGFALQHQYNRLIWDLAGLATGDDRDESTVGGAAAAAAAAVVANASAKTNERPAPPGQTEGAKSEREQHQHRLQQHQHQQRQQKQAQLETTIGRLRLVGNAYYEFGAAVEPLYIFLGYIFYLSYLQPQVYVALRKPIYFDLLRIVLEPQRYWRLVMAPEIERQTHRHLGSSANYLMTRLASACPAAEEPPTIVGNYAPALSPLANGRLIWRQQTLRALERAHEREARQVAELLANDELVPPNRRPEHVERLARLHGAFIVLASIMSTGTMTLLFLIVPNLRLANIRVHLGPRDLLFQAEFYCYCAILIECYIYDMSTIIVTVLDQIAFVTALERMTVRQTEALSLNDTAGTNRGLIQLAILYELLKRQLKGEQADMNFLSANMFILMLMTPVLARLYVAQMALEHRYVYLACSVVIILGCDLVLLPFCWLHARSLELLRARSRLLASIDAHDLLTVRHKKWSARSSSLSLWVASHDEHTVHLLRRDQQVPELALRFFGVNAYFMRLTYASLLGVHFWCGLLLAPMCLRDSARALGASDNLITLLF